MNKIAVIDLDSIAYVIGNPNKVLDSKGEPIKQDGKFVYYDKTVEELETSMNQVMNDILIRSKADSYIAFMKGQNTTTRRKKDNPEYKANRSTEPPKWWNQVQNLLFTCWGAKYVNDIEVDDAVNITRLKLPDSFIAAIDNDLLGLSGTHYNWRKGVWVSVNKEEAEYKFWEDMIAGQIGDNIRGLPGKGPAFVKKVFHDPTGALLRKNLANVVFLEYLKFFGEYKGIKEYVANYMALKILEDYPQFEIPKPIEFKKEISVI